MQHAQISVKHLTTVLTLAAKLIQSGSVVNTGIWTKPRQLREWQTAWPLAGELPGLHDPWGLLKLLLQARVLWEGRKAAAGLWEHWGPRELLCCRGRSRAESTQARATSPAGTSEDHAGREQPWSPPAWSWGPVTPSHKAGGDRPDQHQTQLLPDGAQDCRLAKAAGPLWPLKGTSHGQGCGSGAGWEPPRQRRGILLPRSTGARQDEALHRR